ncbi:MAG: hypothetical protein JXL80_14415, partial [Planctomycetes bacterium]|nr:hypothetical protein [Planctomycetota bacterium]
GAGSALTQRLRLMYYDVAKVGLAAGIMANGGHDGTRLLNVGNSLKTCMVGRRYNPYLHPLTHNVDPRFRREKVWSEGGWDAMAKLNPPHLTSELRQRMPAENFMCAVTRIDGPSVEIACNQIDGALYGERYLTPKMGPLYYGTYQEAPFAAKALAERGFDAQPAPARADRPLLYFGVFGNGAPYEQDVKDEKGFECLWRKGFFPGSTGTAIRSWLGWDRTRPPGEVNKLFEQIVRAGVTVTAGTAGGSHDTNLSWWDNFVFHHLLFSGYEFGEVTLRSMIYLDWTIDMVGDPLYAPDLSKTAADTTAPQVAKAEDIRLAAVPCGNGKFAATVEVDLGNADPEMVETHLTVWKKGEPQQALTGDNWRFNSQPHAWIGGLEPETEYEATVTLVDPYGNRFESKEAFGPLPLRTPTVAETKVIFDKTFESWDGGKPLTVELPNNELDDRGEVHLYYSLVEGAKESAPTIRMAGGANLLNHYSGFRIGGARMGLTIERTPVITGPGDYHMVLRWRRLPVTREILLVKDDGSEWPLAYANTLPWDPSQSVGKSLEIRGGMKVSRIRIVADAAAAPVVRRGPLTDKFDIEAFRK